MQPTASASVTLSCERSHQSRLTNEQLTDQQIAFTRQLENSSPFNTMLFVNCGRTNRKEMVTMIITASTTRRTLQTFHPHRVTDLDFFEKNEDGSAECLARYRVATPACQQLNDRIHVIEEWRSLVGIAVGKPSVATRRTPAFCMSH